MRNFIIVAFLVLISQSKAYACSILNVDIGTSVSAASEKFDFLETFDPSPYGICTRLDLPCLLKIIVRTQI